LASGTSIDWVDAEIRPNLTYIFELRDLFNFELPADQIIDNSIEAFASIVAMLKEGQRRGIA
jgi:hypothetical protein